MSEESYPFLDIDEDDDTEVNDQELGELIAKLHDKDDTCTCEVSNL